MVSMGLEMLNGDHTCKCNQMIFIQTCIVKGINEGCWCIVESTGTQIAKFMGPTCAPPVSCRPRWDPCWPHEPIRAHKAVCLGHRPCCSLWQVQGCSQGITWSVSISTMHWHLFLIIFITSTSKRLKMTNLRHESWQTTPDKNFTLYW